MSESDEADKSRYNKVNARLREVTHKLHKTHSDGPDDFDHNEWLMCEREALMLEQRQIEQVMNANGSIEY